MVVEKKITRKVISKAPVGEAETKEEDQEGVKSTKSRRGCFFCHSKSLPSYTDISTLRRYLTDRAKIVPKIKSNLCSKHQRRVTKQIKYARHLALLPFTPKV